MGTLSGNGISAYSEKVTVGGYVVKKLDGNRFLEDISFQGTSLRGYATKHLDGISPCRAHTKKTARPPWTGSKRSDICHVSDNVFARSYFLYTCLLPTPARPMTHGL
jgi:hypothetical protein